MGNSITAYYYSKTYIERDRSHPVPPTKPKDTKVAQPKGNDKSIIGTDKSLL